MDISVLGIDLAKRVFQLHDVSDSALVTRGGRARNSSDSVTIGI